MNSFPLENERARAHILTAVSLDRYWRYTASTAISKQVFKPPSVDPVAGVMNDIISKLELESEPRKAHHLGSRDNAGLVRFCKVDSGALSLAFVCVLASFSNIVSL